jgi:hypothetical protein
MEEVEVPLEKVQEEMNEKALEHGGGWIPGAALTAAILAVFAALSALLSGYHANEAVIDQIKVSNEWNFFQAKGIKSAVLNSKLELLAALGQEPSEKDQEKVSEYKKEQEEIQNKAREKDEESIHHFHLHEILARSVTFFQIAIAISAVSVLTRRKKFWFLSVGFGAIGMVFLVLSFLQP